MIVRKFSRDWCAGYAGASFGQDAAGLEILDLTGKVLRIGWDQVKWVCYVRDFPASAIPANPERLLHKRFSIRPRTAGLWLRMTLTDGEELEGLAANDRSLIEGAGLLLTPPDTRSNTQRIYVPRAGHPDPGSGQPDRRRRSQGSPPCAARPRISPSCSPSTSTQRRRARSGTISSMKLGELATRLGAELRGDAELEITGVKGIEEAGPTEVTFVANPRYAALARKTQAAAVLVEPEFQEIAAATLRIKNPYLAFSRALALFYQPPAYAAGIHPTAVIDPTAEIGEGAHIGAYVVVGPSVRLGAHATLLPHVVLYPGVQTGDHFFAHAHAVVRENCVLGDHVTLENGAIIGADGFGFAKNELGHWEKIPQSGPVRLGNRVDVQANACIDRATVGATRDRRRHQGGQSGPDWPRFAKWAKTPCFARRPAWRAPRSSATT